MHALTRTARLVALASSGAWLLACGALAQSSGVGAYGGVGLGGGLGWPGQQWSNPSIFFPNHAGVGGFVGAPGAGGLREVDPGFADFDPSRASMYHLGGEADLRTPTGFDRVYVGADGRFYRISGSLVAAFERSSYVAGPGGVYPEVPPGTIYYTGGLPPEALGEGPTRVFPRVDGRRGGPLRNSVSDASPATSGPPASPPAFGGIGYRSGSVTAAPARTPEAEASAPTMLTDEAYRASRMGVLLRDASQKR